MSDSLQPVAAIDAYLDGEATDDEVRELRRWLDENPDEGAQLLSERAFLHARLEQMFGGDRVDDVIANASPRSKATTWVQRGVDYVRRPTPFSLTVAAMVMLLLITTMAFMVPPFYRAMTAKDKHTNLDPHRIVAELTELHDAVWADGQAATHRGAFLQSRHRLSLRSGAVGITFRNGTRVVLEGPAELVVQTHDTGVLSQGRLFATVPPSARGFVVETPHAKVTDLGTEFGVQVDQRGETYVSVTQGKVELQVIDPKLNSGGTQVLNAGTSVTVDVAGRTRIAARDEVTFLRDVPRKSATVLTFTIDNPVPKNGSPIPQGYGDNVSALADVRDSHNFYYHGQKELTPDIAVNYAAGNGGAYLVWNTDDWSDGVGFLRSEENATSQRPYYDTTFTPAVGKGVRVTRFVLDDWDGDGQGHTVSWRLYAGSVAAENVLIERNDVTLASDQELIISTGMTTHVARPLTLRIEHTAGKGNYLAIDSIQFDQSNTGSEK